MQQPVSPKTFEAADAGDVNAQILLGASYLYRRNDLPRDLTKACNYLQKAYAQGSGLACMFLMQMHENGIGKTVDLKAAYEWALEAKRLKATWIGQDEDIARLGRGEALESKKYSPLSHEQMEKRIRMGSYSTYRSVSGQTDSRPFIYQRCKIPVCYAEHVQIDGGGMRTTNWPEGDIQGYLENAQAGDMLIFAAWRGVTRWPSDDEIFDYTTDGWVPHVDLGYR